MLNRETTHMRRLWVAVSHISTLFRLHTGKATAGKAIWQKDGSALVIGARPITLGLGLLNNDPVVGAGDLIGWTTRIITQDMVGKRVAIYTAIEAKVEDSAVQKKTAHKSKSQKNYIHQVRQAGGLAGFASTETEALQIVQSDLL